MAKPKPPAAKKGAPEYMNTYGDMITLMLVFFVLLFSMSTIDAEKFRALVDSYSGKPTIITGGDMWDNDGPGLVEFNISDVDDSPTPDPTSSEDDNLTEADRKAAAEAAVQAETMSRIENSFKTYLALNEVTNEIKVENFGDHLRITFPDGMLFSSGSAELHETAKEALDFIAEELLKYPDHIIRVEGHTDNVPQVKPPYPSNQHLSSARASEIVVYLRNKFGFDPTMIFAEGRDEFWPVDTNETPEGRAANRRVEIKLYYTAPNDGIFP